MSSRRHFLKLAGSTTVLGVLQLRCGSSTSGAAPASGPVSAGNVSSVPVGHLDFVDNEPIILGRDAGGLYAMTSICTHQDCNMSGSGGIDASGIFCSCHGSRFTRTGAVAQGPAQSALIHYKVDLAADGTITVQANSIVDASARTSV